MMLGARTGAWAKSGAPRPYDAELQYAIRASYSQPPLEIPFKATEMTAYEIKVKYLDRTNARNLFGARDSATVANVSNTMNSVDFGNYTQTRLLFSVSSGDEVTVRNSAADSSVVVNGVETKSTLEYTGGHFVGTNNMLLSGVGGQHMSGMEGYYYYAKIWDNGILLFDLIPVRVGELAYWYNKVINELMDYSYTFTAGPDKVG